jgi:hypothetical protein
MSDEARQLYVKAMTMLEEAKTICDHVNHRHNWDSDGPGYTCSDCGDFGYGPCAFCAATTQTAAGG